MLTSTATFNNEVRTKEIDFIYDHNGMRTGKIISENGKVEITEYKLHGKLITHLTKRVVNEEGVETGSDEPHFFYDAQARSAFMEYAGIKHRYVHNFQGDIVAIVDASGNLVVEYKYDAWGNPIGSLPQNGIGFLNPFRYRGYVWDMRKLWNNAKEYVQDAFQAQQQADIMSMQMTYAAGTKALNWLSDNWKDVVDWAGIVYTGAVLGLNQAAKAGIIVIAPWAAAAMTIADVGFWIYAFADKLEWW